MRGLQPVGSVLPATSREDLYTSVDYRLVVRKRSSGPVPSPTATARTPFPADPMSVGPCRFRLTIPDSGAARQLFSGQNCYFLSSDLVNRPRSQHRARGPSDGMRVGGTQRRFFRRRSQRLRIQVTFLTIGDHARCGSTSRCARPLPRARTVPLRCERAQSRRLSADSKQQVSAGPIEVGPAGCL